MDNDTGRDIISLTDESGREHEFEVVDTLEYRDSDYYAMIPVFDDPVSLLQDSGELVIMRVAGGDGADQYLETITDDDEYDTVADMFVERLGDEFDFEEEDDRPLN